MLLPLATGLALLAQAIIPPIIHPLPDSDNCRALRQALTSATTDFSALDKLHLKLPAKGLDGCSSKIGKRVSAFLCNWTFAESEQGAAMITAAELAACMTRVEGVLGMEETALDELSWKLSPSLTVSLRTPPPVAGRSTVVFRVIAQNE